MRKDVMLQNWYSPVMSMEMYQTLKTGVCKILIYLKFLVLLSNQFVLELQICFCILGVDGCKLCFDDGEKWDSRYIVCFLYSMVM